MLWTVNPSEVDMVMVITEGVAKVAMDVGGRGDQPTTINGIDISNPSHSFTRQEWEELGDGCSIVHQLCEQNQNGGHRWGPSGHGGGGQNNNNRNAVLVQLKPRTQTLQQTLPLL